MKTYYYTWGFQHHSTRNGLIELSIKQYGNSWPQSQLSVTTSGTLFSGSCETFTKAVHILGNKIYVNKFWSIEIIESPHFDNGELN